MKKIHSILFVFGALLGAPVLFAHAVNGHDHAGLQFQSVVTTMTFADGTKAVWEVVKGQHADEAYTIEITPAKTADSTTDDKDCALSLLTLGIQCLAADSKVTVLSGNVKIKTDTAKGASWTTVAPGGSIDLEQIRNSSHIKDSDVGLIRIEGGSAKLDVVSTRVRKGHTNWKSRRSSHDTTPPPPYGGGEN